jgi:tetratricopeptide (TPR) repeat protein
MQVSTNDDMLVATTHWLYMTLRRMRKNEQAAKLLERIHNKMEIIEDFDYYDLLLMYQQKRSVESLLGASGGNDLKSSTLLYGIGNWYQYNGQTEKAREIFRRILEGKQWAAFGYLAAEAELAHSSHN